MRVSWKLRSYAALWRAWGRLFQQLCPPHESELDAKGKKRHRNTIHIRMCAECDAFRRSHQRHRRHWVSSASNDVNYCQLHNFGVQYRDYPTAARAHSLHSVSILSSESKEASKDEINVHTIWKTCDERHRLADARFSCALEVCLCVCALCVQSKHAWTIDAIADQTIGTYSVLDGKNFFKPKTSKIDSAGKSQSI